MTDDSPNMPDSADPGEILIPADAPLDLCPEFRTAFTAAAAGAEIILGYYQRGVAMRAKSQQETYNLVSDADIEAEKVIGKTIRQQIPGARILGEEQAIDEEQGGTADALTDNLWIVDPLDGTNNFAHRIPHFAVSIACYRQGRALCGVIVNPVRKDWYWAMRGQGAFHNGRRLRVDPADQLSQAMIGCGFYYDRGAMMEATLAAIHDFFKQNIHGIRRFGTAALDFCHVAEGLYGAFFEYQLHPWDFAAGQLIVEEAGGLVTDARGLPLELRKTSVLVSNTHLHRPCLEIVGKHHPA